MSDQGYPRQGGNPGQPAGKHGQAEHGQQPPRQPESAQQYPGPDGTVQHPGACDPARFAAVPPQSPTGGYPPPGGAGGGGRNKDLIAGIGALVVAGTAGYPPPDGAGGGRRKKGLIAGIGALVVAGIVMLLVAGVSSSDASTSPRDQVKKLFEAERTHDVVAAKKVLCAVDQGQAVQYARPRPHLPKEFRLKSYRITSVRSSGNAGEATVTITDEAGRRASVPIPMRKEDGTWKVCPEPNGPNSNAPSDGPGASLPSNLPTGSVTSISLTSVPVPSVRSLPSIGGGGINACQYATSASDAAATFLVMVDTHDLDLAQACVADGAVPLRTTEALAKLTTGDPINISAEQVRGDVVTYKTLSGQHVIKIKVRKSGSGYQITGLSVT